MKRILLILSLWLTMPIFLLADMVPLKSGDAKGLVVTATQTYMGDDFLQYAGSDAGLYLEYGLKSLTVQNILINSEELRLEIYEMVSPEAAYGIYSVSVVRCTFRDTIAAFDCQSRYQYQGATGNCYLFITSPAGNPRCGPYLMTVAKAFIAANPADPFRFPEAFTKGRINSSGKMIYYVSGMVGMQNCPVPWENLMFGIRFSMYFTLIPDQWGDIFFARFNFPQAGDLNRFLAAAGLIELNVPVTSRLKDGIFREYQATADPLTIYFLESQQTISIRQVTGGY